MEKADREVLGILLQMMDDGTLTDGRGRKIDCRNCILILTSNLGATYAEGDRQIGFCDAGNRPSDDGLAASSLREIRRFFTPEFLNRIDQTIVFGRLSQSDLAAIASHLLAEAASRAKGAGVDLSWNDNLPRLIAEKGTDSDAGARPMRRYLTKWIEDPLADLILSEADPPAAVRVVVKDGKPTLREIEKSAL